MNLIKPYQGKFSTVLLFGPPGSGKETLGKFLGNSGSQYHLSSRQIFRSLPPFSPAGQLYHSYASQGLLLPDEATVEIWKYYVHGLIATNSYNPETQDLLLDGLPRTPKQAELMKELINVRHIIILDIADRDELFKRMELRARQEGRLDQVDQTVIKSRVKNYENEINSLLSYYPHHLVSHVDAQQRPLEVLRDVLVRLSHLLSRTPHQNASLQKKNP